MGNVLMNPITEEGGIVSSQVTATAGDVLRGRTYLGSDTNDGIGTGTLALTGTALAGDVLKNATFYNTDAKIQQTGTLELTGDADVGDVIYGKTFYRTNAKTKLNGALALSGNATVGDVLSGSTFYSTDAKTKQTGTLTLSGDATASDVISGKTFYNTNAKSKQTGSYTKAVFLKNEEVRPYLSQFLDQYGYWIVKPGLVLITLNLHEPGGSNIESDSYAFYPPNSIDHAYYIYVFPALTINRYFSVGASSIAFTRIDTSYDGYFILLQP